MTEAEFRCYRLGQWISAVVVDWLPPGAWEACPTIGAPPPGDEVVLAVAGTWNTGSVAVVGATMDGALFLAWAADRATDEQLVDVFARAARRWKVVEVVVAQRYRPDLVRALADEQVAVDVWLNRADLEVTSATEWRRAIVEGRVAHDHSQVLAEHVGASVARSTPDGSLRLVQPDDDRPVDAARAARMAWWRARDVGARLETPAVF